MNPDDPHPKMAYDAAALRRLVADQFAKLSNDDVGQLMSILSTAPSRRAMQRAAAAPTPYMDAIHSAAILAIVEEAERRRQAIELAERN
jgi:hypothetical protein